MTATVIDLMTREPLDTARTDESDLPPVIFTAAEALEGARDHLQALSELIDGGEAREHLVAADVFVGAVLTIMEQDEPGAEDKAARHGGG